MRAIFSSAACLKARTPLALRLAMERTRRRVATAIVAAHHQQQNHEKCLSNSGAVSQTNEPVECGSHERHASSGQK